MYFFFLTLHLLGTWRFEMIKKKRGCISSREERGRWKLLPFMEKIFLEYV